MSNYPDNMGDDSHLDSDETGNRLTCGCYEEQCECLKCDYCSEIIEDDYYIIDGKEVHVDCGVEEDCRHSMTELTDEEAPTDSLMRLTYTCLNCGSIGIASYQISETIWGVEEE